MELNRKQQKGTERNRIEWKSKEEEEEEEEIEWNKMEQIRTKMEKI